MNDGIIAMVKTWYTWYGQSHEPEPGNRMDVRWSPTGCTPKTGRWSQFLGWTWVNHLPTLQIEAGIQELPLKRPARSLDFLMRIWCRIPGVIIFPYVGTRPAASLMVFFSLTSRVLAVPRWPCPDLRDRRDPPRRQEFSMEDLCISQQKPPFPREKNLISIFTKPSDWWRNALLCPHWSNMGACWWLLSSCLKIFEPTGFI